MKTFKLSTGYSFISAIIILSAAHAAFAGVGNDTWTGGSGGGDNWNDAANWLPGSTNAPPLAHDALFFDGNTRTSPNNDFTSGTAFDGITFNNGAGTFTLGGNSILLSGNADNVNNGVVNNSSSAQTVNLNLDLDWGYHTFTSPAGSLNLDGALTANLAGIADFGTVNVGSASLTADGTGLISGLGGAGLIGNSAQLNGFTNLATISGGVIVPYVYSSDPNVTITTAGGTMGALTPDTATNIEITTTAAGNFTLAGGTSTTYGVNNTYINTILLTVNSTSKQTGRNVPSGTGTLVLGSTNSGTGMYVGGIYLPWGQSAQEITIGGGANCFLTAGPMSGNPVPGEIIFGINGNNTSNEGELNATVKDNLSGGAVTVVSAGSGSMYFNLANTYSGGTYVDKGYLQGNVGTGADGNSCFGSGPVYVASGATVFPNKSGGVFSNTFYFSPGFGFPGGGTGYGNMRPGAETFAGPIILRGSAGTTPGSICRINMQAAGVTISGQISGTGGLEAYSGNANGSIILGNSGNPNNWAGGLIIDGTGNNNSLLTIGANNQLASNNIIFIHSGTGVAELNLAGFNDTVGGLFTTNSDALNLVANSSATPSTLTIGANGATATFAGNIGYTASNNIALVKIGSGTQTFAGLNTYTGDTYITGGTLALTNAANLSSSASISISNATYDTSGLSIPDTANAMFSLTNATFVLSVASQSSTNETTATLNLGGTTNLINVVSLPVVTAYPTHFHLIGYTTLNGDFNIGLGSLPANTPPYAGYITNDTVNGVVDLVLTGGPAPVRDLTWSGTDGSNPNNWDVGGSFNWHTNGGPATTYNQTDFVTFDDTASGSTTVNLTTTLTPTSVTVSNDTHNYTFNGSGHLSGSTGLDKEGSGNLVLDESPDDDFTGGVIIGGGTLQVGNNDGNGSLGSASPNIVNNGALVFNRSDASLTVNNVISGSGTVANNGTGAVTLGGANTINNTVSVNAGTLKLGNSSALGSGNTTVVANNATLDLNGFTALHNNTVTAEGDGSSGQGAIDNSSLTTSAPGLTNLTLTGNASIGASVGRWDLRSPNGDPAASTLSTGGNAYNLNKVGAQFFGLVSTTVDPMIADVDVQGGTFDFEGNTTGLGNPSGTLSIENSAIFEMWNATNQLNKNIVLNDGSTFYSANGNNVVIGSITLNGTAYVNVTNGSLTLNNGGTGINGSGTLVKNGTSTLTINGVDSHDGGTVVNDGTLLLNSINSSANVITENTSQSGSAIHVTLGGNGTNAGPVDIEDQLWPGVAGQPGTIGIGNGPGNEYPGMDSALAFGAQGLGIPSVIFTLNTNATVGGGVNDLVTINGDFDGNFAHVKINPLGALDTGTPYTLVTYTGSKSLNFNAGVSLLSGTSRYNFTLNYPANAVTLSVSGGPALLVWTNDANNGQWDVNGSQNWFNTGSSSSDVFYNQDTVLLDDSILAAANPLTTLTIPSSVTVSPLVITNDSTTNYTITGAGKITGATSIVKEGDSTLTLATANDFDGTVTVEGGTLLLGNNSALGSTNGATIITNGATLDFGSTINNNIYIGAEPVYVSGAGVDGNGAIVNNSGSGNYPGGNGNIMNIVMQGDTTIGGSGRMDMRAAGASLSTGGQPYKLTVMNTNQNGFNMVGVQVDPALGDIDIKAGLTGIQGDMTLGNVESNLTIFGGAVFQLYDLTAANGLDKSVVLLDGASLHNAHHANIVTGPVTLSTNSLGGPGDCYFTMGGNGMTNSGVISGPGNLIKTNGGSGLWLTAANTYTGDTLVAQGTLFLAGNGSIDDSANIVLANGATLDVAGRTDGALTLNSGQTLAGVGTLNGSLTNNGNVASGFSGATGQLTVSADASLNNATTMKLDKDNSTNDVLVVNGGLTYGGTLDLTTLSGTLAANDSFKLFNAGTYNGNFANIVPANPNNDPSLSWDTSSLNVNGTLKVVSTVVPVPQITGISLSGTMLTITATNGSASGSFVLLQSTNVALPLAQWTPVLTNNFDGSGNLDLSTNIVNPADGQEFYILQTQ